MFMALTSRVFTDREIDQKIGQSGLLWDIYLLGYRPGDRDIDKEILMRRVCCCWPYPLGYQPIGRLIGRSGDQSIRSPLGSLLIGRSIRRLGNQFGA